ncbi:MAG TPA: Wzz/FepE/Etk N-terminal domain-containing protein [Burkholderiaceae bacterium]|nr:Wzz/FepE/Etk N-terminal domain-containing protein [Burkholderiaceae bacterium]
MSIWQLLAILWARKQIVLLVVVTAIVGAAVTLTLLPRRYDATAQLIINLAERNQATNEVVSFAGSRDFIHTQIEFAKTRAVAEKVADDLKLVRNSLERADVAYDLLSGLNVSRVGASNMIAVTYRDQSPERAARLANAFAEAHVAKDLETRVLPARESLMWYGERIAELQQKLATAQSRRAEAQRVSGAQVNLSGPAEDAQMAAARLEVIQAKVALDQARQDQASQTTRSETVEALKKRISEIDLRISTEMRIHRLSAEHGVVRNLNEIRNALIQQLNEAQGVERKDQIAKAELRLTAAQRRYNGLMGVVDDQFQRASDDSGSQFQLAVLTRESDALQKQIQDMLQRREQLRLESEISRTPVSLLTTASVPGSPSSPNVRLALGLALMMGLAIGLCLAFLREMLDRRIRCEDDVHGLGPSLLAVVPSTPIMPRFRRRQEA